MLRLLSELLSIAGALDGADVEYALCGGFALAVHGHPRFTKDIDLIVHADDVCAVQDVAARLGFRVPAAPMTFGARTPHPRIVHRVSKLLPDGEVLTLDLLVLDESFDGLWRTREDHEVDGCLIHVVSRDGLIRLKQVAGRDQDLLDIQALTEPTRVQEAGDGENG